MLEPERTQKIWCLRVTYSIRKFTRAQARARIRAPTTTHPHTHTHTQKYAILIAFYDNNGLVNATQYYVKPTFPVLFLFFGFK
jgi:hypothetical protein